MSSGFVSGGTADQPIERDEEWKRVAQELEDARKAKEDLAKQQGGKSLYEVLQANKEKKQAEFEEKARFKLHNALDDDEADYLESLLEKKRQEEANVRKETSEQLEFFRRQREEEERKALEDDASTQPADGNGSWAAVGRKRKKAAESGILKGVKLRKSSTVPEGANSRKEATLDDSKHGVAAIPFAKSSSEVEMAKTIAKSSAKDPEGSSTKTPAKASSTLALGLGYASSDDDD